MTQQAELLKKIDTLPPKYLGEVIEFIGYLQHKAQQETERLVLTEEQKARERECFALHADELNSEMAEILLDQSWEPEAPLEI